MAANGHDGHAREPDVAVESAGNSRREFQPGSWSTGTTETAQVEISGLQKFLAVVTTAKEEEEAATAQKNATINSGLSCKKTREWGSMVDVEMGMYAHFCFSLSFFRGPGSRDSDACADLSEQSQALIITWEGPSISFCSFPFSPQVCQDWPHPFRAARNKSLRMMLQPTQIT
jgi:hypothetical protein